MQENENEFFESLINEIISMLFKKKCKNCGSKIVWLDKKIYMIKCSWNFCGLRYSIFQGNDFKGNISDNKERLLIYLKWIEGASISKLVMWTRFDRYKVYRTLKDLRNLELLDKYYTNFEL
ncbi:hypothetical protein DMUE_5741 [Dictyocoela muelleri]|nr:hypothetical protein DMUE_5741 [Dictyocoela muelleri]